MSNAGQEKPLRKSWIARALGTPARFSSVLAAICAVFVFVLVLPGFEEGQRMVDISRQIGKAGGCSLVVFIVLFSMIAPIISVGRWFLSFAPPEKKLTARNAPGDLVPPVATRKPGGEAENVSLLENPDEVFEKYNSFDIQEAPPAKDSRSAVGTMVSVIFMFLIWNFFKSGAFETMRLLNGGCMPYAVVAVIAIVGTVVVSLLRSRRAKEVRDDRSIAAKRILSNLQAGHQDESFVLYLRPFALGRGQMMEDSVQGKFDFEEVLSNALSHIGTLVAIGRPDTLPGAAKLESSEEDWKAKVSALAAASSLVVIVLGRAPGLYWELEEIKKQGLLWKAIFLWPTGLSDKYWGETVASVKSLGWSLPDARPTALGGYGFILNESGKMLGLETLPLGPSVPGYRAAMDTLCGYLGL